MKTAYDIVSGAQVTRNKKNMKIVCQPLYQNLKNNNKISHIRYSLHIFQLQSA